MLIATSPNNLFIASAGKYGFVQVTYFDSMKLVRELEINYGEAIHISFFPDSQHILVCAHDRWHQKPDTLEVFDVLTGSCVSICRLDDVDTPLVSHNGQSVFFSFGWRSSLAQWDWQTSNIPTILFDGRVFKRNEYFIRALSLNGNNLIVTKYIALDWPKEQEYTDISHLEIWDVKSGTVVQSFPGYQRAASLPDNRLILAVNAKDGQLRILNIENEQIERELAHSIHITKHPNSGQLFVTPDGHYAIANTDILDLQTWKLLPELPWRDYDKSTITADSRYIVYHPGNERWDIEKGKHIVVK